MTSHLSLLADRHREGVPEQLLESPSKGESEDFDHMEHTVQTSQISRLGY